MITEETTDILLGETTDILLVETMVATMEEVTAEAEVMVAVAAATEIILMHLIICCLIF